MDYGQLVMDNEFAEMIKFMLKGVPVRQDTLALDVIKKVGQFKEFVSQEHTFHHMKQHQTYPRFIDRKMREAWVSEGQTNIYDRAWEEAANILETHHPEPLPRDTQDTIRQIVKTAENEF